MNRITKHKLDAKKLYEFSKGQRELTENGSKKITSSKISREFVENNLDFFVKKDCSTLKRLSLDLINNNDSPKLPEILHNKMSTHRLVSEKEVRETSAKESKRKHFKKLRDARSAEQYFEILSVYEATGSCPKVKHEWKSKRKGEDCFVKVHRGGGIRGTIVNELSNEELEFMILDNPYYVCKYATTTKQRLPEKIEQKFLKESPEDYVRWKRRDKEYRLPTLKVVLRYCDKFNVALPSSMHNKIIFLSASGEYITDGRVNNEGLLRYKHISRREIPESHRCLYRRYIYRYQKFVEGLSDFVAKKRLNFDNKISDLLKKRMGKKDRRYLETYVEVQMLDKNDTIDKLIPKKAAA